MTSRNLKTIEELMDYIYGNGTRLLLVREEQSGSAEVSNAKYIGGWGKEPLQDVITDFLQSQQNQQTPPQQETKTK